MKTIMIRIVLIFCLLAWAFACPPKCHNYAETMQCNKLEDPCNLDGCQCCKGLTCKWTRGQIFWGTNGNCEPCIAGESCTAAVRDWEDPNPTPTWRTETETPLWYNIHQQKIGDIQQVPPPEQVHFETMQLTLWKINRGAKHAPDLLFFTKLPNYGKSLIYNFDFIYVISTQSRQKLITKFNQTI